MRNLTTILALLILLLPTVSHAQDDWAVVKAVPPGTLLRINSSITGRLDAVDDTQITLSGRRLIQDVVGRVERVGVGGKRKRNGWIGVLGGAVFGATAMRVNGGNALGMAWQGALWGGLGGLIARTASRPPANRIIYQR